jgi:hypothetical protein
MEGDKQDYWDGVVKLTSDLLGDDQGKLLSNIKGPVASALANCSELGYALELMAAWVRIGKIVTGGEEVDGDV